MGRRECFDAALTDQRCPASRTRMPPRSWRLRPQRASGSPPGNAWDLPALGILDQTLAQLVEQARVREARTDQQIAKLFTLVRHQGQQIDRLIVMGKTLLWVGGGLWALTQFVVPMLR